MADRRLRVLFVSHTYVVGVNQHKLHCLAATGAVDVGLVVPRVWAEQMAPRPLALECAYPEVRVYPAAVWWGGRVGAYLYPPWMLRRALVEFRPDLVHVEEEVFALSTFEVALIATSLRIPLSVFCWQTVELPVSVVRRATRRYVLRSARLIIPGNHEAARLIRGWGYEGPIEVMPQLGVDTRLFPPRPRAAHDKAFVIGFVGRLAHWKGVDLLLAAAHELRGRGLALQLVICGTGPEEQSLRAEAGRLGVADLVTWRGALRHDQVPGEMAGFDVLVLPSRVTPGVKEQFGHVLIEAMSMGVAVVGSDCGGIPDVIGRKDLVFRQDDVAGLSAILERMIRDSRWRESAGQHGVLRVQQHFSDERIAERLISAWERVLSA